MGAGGSRPSCLAPEARRDGRRMAGRASKSGLELARGRTDGRAGGGRPIGLGRVPWGGGSALSRGSDRGGTLRSRRRWRGLAGCGFAERRSVSVRRRGRAAEWSKAGTRAPSARPIGVPRAPQARPGSRPGSRYRAIPGPTLLPVSTRSSSGESLGTTRADRSESSGQSDPQIPGEAERGTSEPKAGRRQRLHHPQDHQ